MSQPNGRSVQAYARPAASANRRRGQVTLRIVLLSAGVVGALAAGFVIYRLSRPLVAVTDVVEGRVVEAFYATGTVQPVREYPIHSNLAGIVTEVMVDKGDVVKRGQPLAVVTDSQLVFAADKARAELEKARDFADEKTSAVIQDIAANTKAGEEILDITRREEKRLSGLAEQRAASWADHDRALDRMKTAWSELESLRSQRVARL